MGKQIEFHALPEDLELFLDFAKRRYPITITLKSSDSANVLPVADPIHEARTMTIWNNSLVKTLDRELIVVPGRKYYRINDSLPTLELVPSTKSMWCGKPALLKGRLYGSFEEPTDSYLKWYQSLARWIRANFVKNPVISLSGYVGPSAMMWFRDGGCFLPMLEPPKSPRWVKLIEDQAAVRHQLNS